MSARAYPSSLSHLIASTHLMWLITSTHCHTHAYTPAHTHTHSEQICCGACGSCRFRRSEKSTASFLLPLSVPLSLSRPLVRLGRPLGFSLSLSEIGSLDRRPRQQHTGNTPTTTQKRQRRSRIFSTFRFRPPLHCNLDLGSWCPSPDSSITALVVLLAGEWMCPTGVWSVGWMCGWVGGWVVRSGHPELT